MTKIQTLKALKRSKEWAKLNKNKAGKWQRLNVWVQRVGFRWQFGVSAVKPNTLKRVNPSETCKTRSLSAGQTILNLKKTDEDGKVLL
jgi:hypothetical protein